MMKKLSIYLLSILVIFMATQLTGCKSEGCTDANADNFDPDADKDDGSCTYTNYVLTGIMSSPRTLVDRFDDPTIPDYLLEGEFGVESALTIMPGVTIQAANGAFINVGGSGSINAVGTSAKNITFKGESTISGAWVGIHISTPSPSNRLEYVNILHAGSDAFFGGALSMEVNGKVAIKNSTFSYSERHGIYMKYKEAQFTEFQNNHFDNISGYPIWAHMNQVPSIDNGSTFDGTTNALNYIWIEGGEATQPFIWKKAGAPYLIGSPWWAPANPKADVTIEAGTDIVFDDKAALWFQGVVTAQGNAQNPINFRGRIATPGFGCTIILVTPGNVFDHVNVLNLGNTDNGGWEGMLSIDDGASLTATNCTISGSNTWGVYQYLTGLFFDGGGNTFSNNAYGDVN